MIVNIEDIGDAGLAIETSLSPAWVNEALGDSTGYRAAQGSSVNAHLLRAADTVIVQGGATLELLSSCARCLAEVSVALQVALHCPMVPRQSAPTPDADGQLSGEEIDVATYEDGQIDLGAVVREEMLLGLPMQMLCRDDCRGLCSQCGANQNKAPCSCVDQTGDIRLAGLARIKLEKPVS